MPGSIELQGPRLDLIETPVPGVSRTVEYKARNAGTTKLDSISIKVEGDGAGQVQLAAKKNHWAEAGRGIVLSDIAPGGEENFYVRASYGSDDAEDRKDFKVVAMAMSVG